MNISTQETVKRQAKEVCILLVFLVCSKVNHIQAAQSSASMQVFFTIPYKAELVSQNASQNNLKKASIEGNNLSISTAMNESTPICVHTNDHNFNYSFQTAGANVSGKTYLHNEKGNNIPFELKAKGKSKITNIPFVETYLPSRDNFLSMATTPCKNRLNLYAEFTEKDKKQFVSDNYYGAVALIVSSE